MLTPVSLPTFRGLDLRDDPQEQPGAVDLLNVDFDQQGRLRTRDGYSKFTSVAGTNQYDSLVCFIRSSTSPVFEIVAGAGNRLEALNFAGTVTATSTAPTQSPHFFARWGSPTAEYIYIANGVDQIRRYDGAAFTSPAGLAAQTGRFLAIQTPDNRLVHASTVTNPSRVAFSDPGLSETWTANSYVDIKPGDGERVNALVQWRNQLFAFKQSSFAVFYGNSTDSTGQPVFNYRTVEGAGCIGLGAACAGPDGVYFLNENGIYRTTGGSPVCVSNPIEPLFRGGADTSLWTGTQSARSVNRNSAQVPVSHYGRLYFPVRATAGGGITLVYDPQTAQWAFWLFSETQGYFATAPSGTAGLPNQLLWPGISSKHIFSQVKPASGAGAPVTTDDGTAITSRYRTGFLDLGTSEVEKTVREVLLDGTGTVTLKAAVNDTATLGTGESVVMGTSPAVAQGRSRTAGNVRGRNVSVEISATSAWSLSRMTFNVRGQRAPGEKST